MATKTKKDAAKKDKVKIEAVTVYDDYQLDKRIQKGETYEVTQERAEQIVKAGFARLVKAEATDDKTPV